MAIPEVARVARESVYSGAVRLGESPGEFLRAVSIAMADKDPILAEKRVLMARDHTWERVAERIELELKKALRAQAQRLSSAVVEKPMDI